jgi:hypothetical protein
LVSRESLVTIATNRYSVPVQFVGQAVTVRLYPDRIAFFHGMDRVAVHSRLFGRQQRSVIPEHFEPVFAVKPRARIMVYRDWLVNLSPCAADYISRLCQKRSTEMEAHICALYDVAQQVGRAPFLAALERAAEQHAVGAEYVRALLNHSSCLPQPSSSGCAVVPAWLGAVPPQHEVERALAQYEAYVANRQQIMAVSDGGAGCR